MTSPVAPVRLVVVGGGPTAHATVAAYREAGGDGDVLLLSEDERPPYRRPPLSKDVLRGEAGLDDVGMEDPGWYAEHGVELRLRTRVEALDPARHVVRTADGAEEAFTTCVLAVGAHPVRPPLPGADDPEVLLLRSAADADRLRGRAAAARSAVVVGSGFIGCEAAVSLARRGLDVTLVTPEDGPQAARLGDEVAEILAGWLRDEGVELRTGTTVARIDDARRVTLEEGGEVAGDLVLLATGVAPCTTLAELAGIAVADGAIRVDERMRTSAAGVLAAGDATLARNAAAGRHLHVEHWGEALSMGEVAGRTAAGADAAWDQGPGFWSQIGDRTLKQVAWGDGFDAVRVDRGPGGAFTAWYGRDGVTVGVLTHERDAEYERGRELVERGLPLPG
ncbi:NAD(P)/FAD-dependent oxidoreductase [Patulibacter sp. S7RM1-6]